MLTSFALLFDALGAAFAVAAGLGSAKAIERRWARLNERGKREK